MGWGRGGAELDAGYFGLKVDAVGGEEGGGHGGERGFDMGVKVVVWLLNKFVGLLEIMTFGS